MKNQVNPKNIPHVVIVGGGFGGLRAAKRLAKAPVRITLVGSQQLPSVSAAAVPGGNRGGVAD